MVVRFRIRLFGYPSISVDEELVQIKRRKSLALLAYLAGDAGRSSMRGCPREAVAAVFWPDCSQDQAGAYLRQALWEINRSAGDDLIHREDKLLKVNPDAWVDTGAFEQLLRDWKTIPNENTAREVLSQAAALYCDDFLAGFNLPDCPEFDRWQSIQSELLRAHFGQALEALSDLWARQGDLAAAAEYARRWLELDNVNEAAHRALIRIHFQNNQPGAALRQYEVCRQTLAEELGIEPGAETQALLREAAGPKTPGPAPAAQVDRTPSGRPTGTVTFLFTDIEGSTRLWQQFPGGMKESFARQEAIIREAVAGHGGTVYKMIGDAFQAAFWSSVDALGAAVDAQRALFSEPWKETGRIKVRMALHTGMTEEREDDYVGPTLNRVARMLSSGHGGQILLNRPTYELVRDDLPGGVVLLDLGECWLKDLDSPEHLYQVTALGLPGEFPPLRMAYQPVSRLPQPSTPFIGREKELSRIQSLFEPPENRLVTLVGIGGIGKTRLAIEALRRHEEKCIGAPQEVGFVGLANAASLADIVTAAAQAVGLAFRSLPGGRIETGNAQKQLFDFLAAKEMLLVLDNFEHLMDHSAFVVELLAAAPKVRLIVTSRLRLNLVGECVIEVTGLSFPGRKGVEEAAKFPAVQLFLQCVERVGQEASAEEELPVVARICQLVEGMPLGVEMAAAWSKMLSCAEIAAEIENDFNFLSSDRRGMPERHRNLRAVFEHSWRLLLEEERSTLLHLAVFQGGFSREKALEVAEAPLLLLSTLMDKSFLRRLSPGRFEIHPVLRSFIVDKLEDDANANELLRQRHAACFCDWLVALDSMLKGRELLAALATIRSERQNVFAAWRYLIEQRDFARLSCCLATIILFEVMDDQLLDQAEFDRIMRSNEEALVSSEAEADEGTRLMMLKVRALTLAALRFSAVRRGLEQQVRQYEQKSAEAIGLLPDSVEKAQAILLSSIGLGHVALQDKITSAQQARDLFERFGDRWGKSVSWMVMGDLATFGTQAYETARSAYQAALEGFAGLENLWGRALCLIGLEFVEKQANNLEAAYQYGLESIEILKRLDSPGHLSMVIQGLGEIAEARGDYALARQHFEANLNYFTEIGDLRGSGYYVERIAAIEGK